MRSDRREDGYYPQPSMNSPLRMCSSISPENRFEMGRQKKSAFLSVPECVSGEEDESIFGNIPETVRSDRSGHQEIYAQSDCDRYEFSNADHLSGDYGQFVSGEAAIVAPCSHQPGLWPTGAGSF